MVPAAKRRFQTNKNDQCADGRPDKSCTLARTIKARGVTYDRCKKGSRHAQNGRDDKTFWRVRTGHQQPRDDAGNKADDNDPEKNTHSSLFHISAAASASALALTS